MRGETRAVLGNLAQDLSAALNRGVDDMAMGFICAASSGRSIWAMTESARPRVRASGLGRGLLFATFNRREHSDSSQTGPDGAYTAQRCGSR